jgi:hypothetical protein
MANKQTIHQVDARMRELIIRLARDANELNELRTKRRLLVTGKLKHPPPPGVKVKIKSNPNGLRADEFGDLVPSFGPRG